jgi:hypothetical protein
MAAIRLERRIAAKASDDFNPDKACVSVTRRRIILVERVVEPNNTVVFHGAEE